MDSKKSEDSSNEGRPAGRPRDPDVERRILEATVQVLAEEGYSRMSMDDIAARVGASKPTIYRRWANKADLATAAIRSIQISEPEVDTGSSTGDLTGILQNFRRSLMRPNGMSLVGNVLAEEHHTPELLALFRERLVTPRRQMLRAVLLKAERAGEIQKDADVDAAVNMLVGAFYAQYLANSRIPTDYPARLVALVWKGIAR